MLGELQMPTVGVCQTLSFSRVCIERKFYNSSHLHDVMDV